MTKPTRGEILSIKESESHISPHLRKQHGGRRLFVVEVDYSRWSDGSPYSLTQWAIDELDCIKCVNQTLNRWYAMDLL